MREVARWRAQWHGDEELPTRSCRLAREAMAGVGMIAEGDAESFDRAGEAAALQTVCGLVVGGGSDVG